MSLQADINDVNRELNRLERWIDRLRRLIGLRAPGGIIHREAELISIAALRVSQVYDVMKQCGADCDKTRANPDASCTHDTD